MVIVSFKEYGRHNTSWPLLPHNNEP
jgi:hypothetical protein